MYTSERKKSENFLKVFKIRALKECTLFTKEQWGSATPFFQKERYGSATPFFDKERERSGTLKKRERLSQWNFWLLFVFQMTLIACVFTLKLLRECLETVSYCQNGWVCLIKTYFGRTYFFVFGNQIALYNTFCLAKMI